MPYNQSAYRFRTDDSQTLNADAGWAAAVNTAASLETGKNIRLRIEIEETVGSGGSQQFTLQYRINSGSWANVEDSLADSPSVWHPIRVGEASQITDGAATTDVLTGAGTSSETFTAGVAVVTDSTSNAVTINNAHSEFEFPLYIAPWEVDDGDVFEFKMVLSGGGDLSSYDVTPTLTVINNTGQIGGVMVESIMDVGPWVDNNGTMYVIVEPQELPTTYAALCKSTNHGLTWARATANSSTFSDLEAIDVYSDGDSLYFAKISSTVEYWKYNMSSHSSTPDNWEVEKDTMFSSPGIEDVVGIVKRSDDTVVLGYQSAPNGADERVAYKIRTSSGSGGTWGSENVIDDTDTGVDFTDIRFVLGKNDKTHIVYADTTNRYVYHRSLDNADSISARERVDDSTIFTGCECPLLKPVYWQDGNGAEKITVAWLNSSQRIATSIITDDGTPAAETTATDNTVLENTADSQHPEAIMGVNGTDVYILYSDNGTQDLFLTKNANGAGWDTDVEEQDGIEARHNGGRVITHPNGVFLGYFWSESSGGDLGGRIIYRELLLSAAPPGGGWTRIYTGVTGPQTNPGYNPGDFVEFRLELASDPGTYSTNTIVIPTAASGVRINCAGNTIADPLGDWEADLSDEASGTGWSNDSVNSSTVFPPGAVTGVPPGIPIALFQSERYADPGATFEYSFTGLTNGDDYELRFYMAEQYLGGEAPGQRVFDIEVNGVIALPNIDPIAMVGEDVVLTLSTTAQPVAGTITATFLHGAAQNPMCNAIELIAGAGGTGGSYNTTVAASSDDAEEAAAGGTPSLTSSDLELGFESATEKIVGVRFTDIPVPQGATVTDAWIQFTADESDSAVSNLTITAEDADNAATFTTAANNISGRTPTTASVAWSSIPAWTSGQRGTDQRTPNLAPVVQEVVDRGSWASGNAIAFLITNASGTSYRVAESFDKGAGTAEFHVTWSGSGGTPPTVSPATGFTATAISSTRIDLAWTDAATNEDLYRIERGFDGVNYSLLTTLPANSSAYSDTGLFPNTTYYYQVRPEKAGSAAPSWVSDSATTDSDVPVSGIEIQPGQNMQSVIDANPVGSTFIIKAGVHREQTITVRPGDSYIGEAPGGTIQSFMNGGTILTGWIAENNYWYKPGMTQQQIIHAGSEQGNSLDGCPRSQTTHEMFADGVRLHHVDSIAKLFDTPPPFTGSTHNWFFDYGADRVYVGVNPSGKLMELADTEFAFTGMADDVTIRNLVVEHYRNPTQKGAIGLANESMSAGQNWLIDNVEVRKNHGVGIKGSHSTWNIRNSDIHHNGQMGIGAGQSGAAYDWEVFNTKIHHNNTAGVSPGWEAGGTKFTRTRRLKIHYCEVYSNEGPGLWCDIDAVDTEYAFNEIYDNMEAGIFHEISFDAIIHHNNIYNNGFRDRRVLDNSRWGWGAGILIAASPEVDVYDNYVFDNFGGICLIQQCRPLNACGGGLNDFVSDCACMCDPDPKKRCRDATIFADLQARSDARLCKNVTVHHNDIRFSGGVNGYCYNDADLVPGILDYFSGGSWGNSFQNNDYTGNTTTDGFSDNTGNNGNHGSLVQYSTWVGYGNDTLNAGVRDTDPDPGIPGNFVANALDHDSIQLTWTAGTDATSYRLEYNTVGFASPFTFLTTTAALSYTHNGLSPATTYYYQIRSEN